MTVASTTNRTQANGNGSTSAFPFSFKFTAASEIEVYVDDALKTLSTHYTLSAPGDSGTVTFLTSPDYRPQTGEVVTIRRIQPLTQTFDPTAGGGLSSSSVEGSDDNLLMKIQQIDEQSDRAPRLKVTTETGQLTFPEPVASAVIAYNAAGTDLETKALADIGAATFPASSTDEAIVRFDGTGGLSFQDSGVTIDDSDNVAGMATLTLPNTGLHLLDTDASHDLIVIPGSNLSADRTFTVTTGDANRNLTLSGDAALDQNLRTSDSPTFVNLTQTGYHDLTEIAEPSSPAANVGRVYAYDESGVTRLAYKTSAGTVSYINDREKLLASRTYYVRTDGSDSNTGLVNSAGGAFLTIQKAIDTAADLDLNGFAVTISVQDGTYTGAVVVSAPWIGGGSVSIAGQSASGTILSVTSATCISVSDAAVLSVSTVELRTTTSGNCLSATTASVITFSDVRFGTCAGFHMESTTGATIAASGNYSIVGNAVAHLHAPFGGVLNISSVTVTLTGTPAFSAYFAGASGGGNIVAVSTTFSGSATGARFLIWKNSHLETNGEDVLTYLPGNSAGTLDAGGTIDDLLGANRIAFGVADVALDFSTNTLAFQGASSGYFFDSAVQPSTDDLAALGTSTVRWSDLFLASGGVINWNNGDVTITHSANALAFAGATSGYIFDDDLFLPSGGSIFWNTNDVAIQHGANLLAFVGATNGYLFDASIDVAGTVQGNALRIDQASSNVGTGTKTISNAADSSTNFGKYFSISLNGTTVFVPCGTVAPT